MATFVGNVIICGKIQTLTGLHIGGSSEGLRIGGMDLPVIRNPRNQEPYIPGSSLKGKLRMITEFMLGDINDGDVVQDPKSRAAQIFGVSPADESGGTRAATVIGPTRLIVRDAFPDGYTRSMWETIDSELLFTENKSENTIDRITSKANPRSIERVVPESCFNFEMVYSIYNFAGLDKSQLHKDDVIPEDIDNLEHLFAAMKLLQDSTLGGHGSRGYGQIAFYLAKELPCKTISAYTNGGAASREFPSDDLAEYRLLNDIDITAEINEIRKRLTAVAN